MVCGSKHVPGWSVLVGDTQPLATRFMCMHAGVQPGERVLLLGSFLSEVQALAAAEQAHASLRLPCFEHEAQRATQRAAVGACDGPAGQSMLPVAAKGHAHAAARGRANMWCCRSCLAAHLCPDPHATPPDRPLPLSPPTHPDQGSSTTLVPSGHCRPTPWPLLALQPPLLHWSCSTSWPLTQPLRLSCAGTAGPWRCCRRCHQVG
jgi:hypothetical protein